MHPDENRASPHFDFSLGRELGHTKLDFWASELQLTMEVVLNYFVCGGLLHSNRQVGVQFAKLMIKMNE